MQYQNLPLKNKDGAELRQLCWSSTKVALQRLTLYSNKSSNEEADTNGKGKTT